MVLYPGQPDLGFDYPLWWNRDEQHENQVFNDIVIHKKHQEHWGSFCEHGLFNKILWNVQMRFSLHSKQI